MTPASNRADQLIQVCRGHILGPEYEAFVSEPYVPYVPEKEKEKEKEKWNGTLVLAEAQNFSNIYRHRPYREALLGWSSDERITRLGRDGKIGVHPWTAGWLKLAVHVGFDLNPDETAVSNAVLWSQVSAKGGNKPPSPELQKRSVAVWAELLAILQPSHVITAGKKAWSILSQVAASSQPSWRHTALVFPAPPNTSRWLKKYDAPGLLTAYPEVARAQREHSDWFSGNIRHKTLFACHAVSEAERPPQAPPIDPPTIHLDRLSAPKEG